MGIRIQPREIDVPEDDPFENDLLDRKEPVEVLTHLVGGLEGPCVLAVDAPWGAGKTTFLRIWAQYLRNHEFPVVQFNAWETDFSGDPFVALSTELAEGLHEYADKSLEAKIEDTKNGAKEVVRQAVPGLIRVLTAGILDVTPLLEQEVGQALASYAEERLSGYQEAQKSVQKFRCTLQDLANALSESRKNRPLIVVIDEADRCRPSYAVELLEIAKHLFSVDHIVFVLAVNRSELEHSIKALYGSGFDAEGYLRRFFDVDLRLPEPERDKFIDGLLNAIQIDDFFKRKQNSVEQQDAENVRNLLQIFFRAPDLSLRRIAQAIHRLGLVFASLGSDQRPFAVMAVVALIMRTINLDLYGKFVRGAVSDLEVVDKMVDGLGAEGLHRQHLVHLFEATIILAAQQVRNPDSIPLESGENYKSPLLERYGYPGGSDPASAADPERARSVLKSFRHFLIRFPGARFPPKCMGFLDSVQRLELLTPGLIEEPVTEQENS